MKGKGQLFSGKEVMSLECLRCLFTGHVMVGYSHLAATSVTTRWVQNSPPLDVAWSKVEVKAFKYLHIFPEAFRRLNPAMLGGRSD